MQDIGAPSPPGQVSATENTVTVVAAGADIGGRADQFTFVYRQITGNVEVIARVDSLSQADKSSKAGVMIRSSLAVDAAHGYALVSAASGNAFQRRTAAGGLTTSTTGAQKTRAPSWVRLIRIGNRVTAFSSTNGGSWRQIDSDTVALGDAACVGVAVASHSTETTTAALSSVTINPLASLPPPMADTDIGSLLLPGTASQQSGTYIITGSGTDIGGTSDQFHFAYRQVTGDIDVAARVASLVGSSTSAKSGLMIRESLTAGARNAYAFATTGKGYAVQRRIDPSGVTTSMPGGAGAPPGWVRLVRQGHQFSAFWSLDGAHWTPIGTDTVPMADTVYVGMAVTSHSSATAATSAIDNYTVQLSSANQPPDAAITTPQNGAAFTAPADITIAASASDPEGRLTQVEFFNGTTSLGQATASPYSVTWSSVPAGTYTLTAVASDSDGGSTASAPVTISVSASGGTSTTAVFQASADHASVTSYLLEVFANGADPDTDTAVASSDLGKPAPDGAGDISVDRTAFFDSLAAGTYVVTVSAMGPGGPARSNAVTFVR